MSEIFLLFALSQSHPLSLLLYLSHSISPTLSHSHYLLLYSLFLPHSLSLHLSLQTVYSTADALKLVQSDNQDSLLSMVSIAAYNHSDAVD